MPQVFPVCHRSDCVLNMSKKNRKKRAARAIGVDSSPDATATPAAEPIASERDSSTQERWRAQWRSPYMFIPVLLAIGASINTLQNEFATDDLQQILNNAFIKKLSNLPLAFTTSVWSFATSDITFAVDSYYRPIFNVLFTINYALFGTTAWGWHLVNVLVHAAVTLLVFVVFRELTNQRWFSAIAASLFAVHPVHAESIAWVSGVTDPLTSVFMLSAFYFYLRFRKGDRKYFLALALGLYFISLLSKETALTLPLLVAYCELFYFEENAPFKQRVIRVMALGGWFMIPTAIYFYMRYLALSGILFGSGPRYPLIPALATIPPAVAKYLLLMLSLTSYSYQHYTAFVESFGSLSFIGPFTLLAVLATSILLIKSRELQFAAAWFVITLAPALAALRQFDPEYLVQERYLYLPSMGFCLAIALGVRWLAGRRPIGLNGRAIATVVTAAMLIGWGAINIAQNRVWHDSLTVYQNCVAADPTSPVTHTSLAITYYQAGKPREAEEEILIARDLDPQCAYVYLNSSYFAHAAGKLDEAIEHLERGALEVKESPMTRYNLATIHLNLGLLYAQRKNVDRAEENLLRSIKIWPRAVGFYHTGQFYLDQGRLEEARGMFEQTSSLVSVRVALVHLRLGQVYDLLGQRERARASYEKYLEFAPPDATDRSQVNSRLSQL